jgi:hypothetical protein
MKKRDWTDEEIEYVKNNYYTQTIPEIAKVLNRNRTGIHRIVKRLGITKKRIPCDIEIGQKINRLTLASKFMKNHTRWGMFKCECNENNLIPVQIWFVVNNQIKSCGCYHVESARNICIERNTTHGKSSTVLHSKWTGMKSRCYNKNNKNYTGYGWRGIKLCDEWRDNFESFYNWSIENGYKKELTIDRLDNNKNYCPENCRWATHAQQVESQHNNRSVIAWNEDKSLIRWIDDPRCKVDIETIKKHLTDGWSTEDALIFPSIEEKK